MLICRCDGCEGLWTTAVMPLGLKANLVLCVHWGTSNQQALHGSHACPSCKVQTCVAFTIDDAAVCLCIDQSLHNGAVARSCRHMQCSIAILESKHRASIV